MATPSFVRTRPPERFTPRSPEAKEEGYTRQDLVKAAQLLDEAGWRLSPGGRVRTKDGVANYARFRDPELDRLMAGVDTAVDAAARREQALRVNRRTTELAPFVPVAGQDRLGAVSRRVRNYVPHFARWIYEVHADLWVEAAPS